MNEKNRSSFLAKHTRALANREKETLKDARSSIGLLVLLLFLGIPGEVRSAHFYFSEFNGGTIRRANLDGTGLITLVSGLASPGGPTLDLARGQMYWGEIGGANIWRANLNGTDPTILISGRNGPGAPALDLVGGRMYWNDSGGGEIRRANLDGTGQQVLVTGQNDPHTLAADFPGGKIYWPDFGAGVIRRANLDGTGQQTLVTGLSSPALMDLDVPGGKMYWTGQGSGDIRRANLDGSHPEIILRNLNSPTGIALDVSNGHIYWSSFNGGNIRRANLDGADQRILTAGLSGPSVITLDLDSGAPSIHVQPQGKTVALGSAFTLNAATAGAKPLFFRWHLNDAPLANATNVTLQIPNAGTSDRGDYRLYVSNSLGVATSQVARLVVADSPIITAEPLARRVIETNGATFIVSAIGAPPLNYQWQWNGTNLDGATATNLSLINVQTNHAGDYTVVVSNSFGSVTSMVATLTVLVRPGIVQQPQSQTVLEGQMVTFTASAIGTWPLGFRWLRSGVTYTNGIILNTATTSVLTLTNVGMSNNAATFRLTVTNEAGTVSSTNARLSVLADFDRDGMSDEWEARYGLNTNSTADAVLDLDGDGASNRDEYLAGTDPLDEQSVLRIAALHVAGGELGLAFFAMSNRTYSLISMPSFSTASWERIIDIATQPSNRVETVVLPATPASQQRFYRVITPKWP